MSDNCSQKDIASAMDISNSYPQAYKKRLIDKGLIYSKEKGKVGFVSPRFKEFVKLEKALYSD